MLSLLMSAHDHNGHYEEANVSQENQNDGSNERVDERCRGIQIAAVRGLKQCSSLRHIMVAFFLRLLIAIIITLVLPEVLSPNES